MPDSPRPWTTLTSETILERWWLRLRVDRVRLPDGAEIDEFHVAEYPDWAVVLALTDEGRAVMVEQYRYGIDRVGLEFPAGVLQTNEDPLVAAKRELLEETGYEATDWTALPRLAIEPARHTNYAHLFVATGARRVAEPNLDMTEDLRVRLAQVSELMTLLEEGAIVHGIHAALVLWAKRRELV